MLAVKLAYKNLLGAGLRTWLNVIVLSFSFVLIIWFKGMLDGWDRQARMDSIAWELGAGQYWQENYDPNDPFTITDSHAPLLPTQKQLAEEGKLVPILITRGTMYPEGRMQNILIKGIDTAQNVLQLPTSDLDTSINEIPAIIGSSVAKNNKLDKGDLVVIRWRDANGTFDATEIMITGIFKTDVPGVDVGQIWIPLERLREMLLMPGEATIIVKNHIMESTPEFAGWDFKDHEYLLKDFDNIIKAKSMGSSIFYIIILALALLAIFDTQVLSVFRRQKEIGTYVAMGMTKSQVVALFTVEGAAHSILAVIVGAIYGIPLFIYQSQKGISFGMTSEDWGITMSETLYPYYTLQLVIATILIVVITTTIVSFLPARKISKMKPTEAIKGKIQ
jgi:ABC-type lipoprotein release transport system permease subunit